MIMNSLNEASPFTNSLSVLGQLMLDTKSANDQRKIENISRNTPYLNGSISNKAKNLIMTFPNLCDDSLPPTTASMICRANERNIVTMLQLLFASMSLRGTDGEEILSRIHKNINFNKSMDDIIDDIDNALEDYGISESVSVVECRRALEEMAVALKTPQKSFPVNSLSERSVNDYDVLNIHGTTVVKEASPLRRTDTQIDQMNDDELDIYTSKLRASGMNRDIDRDAAETIRNANITTRNTNDSQMDALTRRLMDSDVKKANELVPTLMVINYNEVDTDGKIYATKPFIAGVKSRLIAVQSADIIDRIVVKNKTKINFLNFIRATTGEIGFVRDFLLCIDQAKIDAKNSVKKGPAAKMWRVLEDRSIKNNKRRFKTNGNDASAITTLTINQETVNMIKKEHNFDLENVRNARSIMEAYNLLGIIIVDESIEVAKFLYAGNDTYEQLAFSYLERESNDNSYKKIINLIGKMNGR